MLSQIRYIDTLLMLKSVFTGESGWNCPILYNPVPRLEFGMGQGYGTSKVVLRSKNNGTIYFVSHSCPTEIYWYDYDSSNGTRYAPSPRARTAL